MNTSWKDNYQGEKPVGGNKYHPFIIHLRNGELCTAEINPSEFDVDFKGLPSQTQGNTYT